VEPTIALGINDYQEKSCIAIKIPKGYGDIFSVENGGDKQI
jgi:hypothetical protein